MSASDKPTDITVNSESSTYQHQHNNIFNLNLNQVNQNDDEKKDANKDNININIDTHTANNSVLATIQLKLQVMNASKSIHTYINIAILRICYIDSLL